MIEIERIESFPNDVLNYLNDNFESLKRYILRKSEIVDMPSTERGNAVNENSFKWQQAIQSLNLTAFDYKFIVYHCTRLTDKEIKNVLLNGIKPLSIELIKGRIDSALEDGFLSASLAEYLLSKNQCTDDNRVNMFWFAGGKSILRHESTVRRLFSSWGGEALYNSHENDNISSSILKSIGKPCIIKAELFPSEFKANWVDLGEKMIYSYLLSRKIEEVEPPQFDTYIDYPLTPNRFTLIQFEDPLFEKLTNCNNWKEPI